MAVEIPARTRRFLVELAPAPDLDDIQSLTARSRAACRDLARVNVAVRFLRSIYLPEDGTCLFLLDADSPTAVEAVSRLARLPITRMSELLAPSESDA